MPPYKDASLRTDIALFAELILDVIHVHKGNKLAVILPSTLLSAVIIILLIIVIVLIFFRRFQRHNSANASPPIDIESKSQGSTVTVPCTNPKAYKNEIEYVRANLRKVRNTVSATNPLSMIDPVPDLA